MGRKTLRTGLHIGAFWSILLLTLYILYLAGASYYDTAENKKVRKVLSNPEYSEALVFGSSHANAINLLLLDYNGTMLHHNGADMFEVSYKLNTLIPRLANLKTVMISVSYFSFEYDNAAYINRQGVDTRADRRIRLYAAYHSMDYIEGDFRNYLKGKLYPLVTIDHWEKILCGSRPYQRRINMEMRMKMTQSEKFLRNDAMVKVKYLKKNIENMQANNPDLHEKALAAIEDVLSLLKKYENIRIVFVTPPFYHAYNEVYPAEFKTRMHSNMDYLQTRYNIEYYDFSKDKEFANDHTLFVNSNHLNNRGIVLFCSKLKALLNRTL
jgi:hypothetical protein